LSLWPPLQQAFPAFSTNLTVDSWFRWKTVEKWGAFHVVWNVSAGMSIVGTNITDGLQAFVQPPLLAMIDSTITLSSIYVSCWQGGVCVRQYDHPVNVAGTLAAPHLASSICASLVRKLFLSGRFYTAKLYTPPLPPTFLVGDKWTTRGLSRVGSLVAILNSGFAWTLAGTFSPHAFSPKFNSYPGHTPFRMAPHPTWLYRHRPRGSSKNRFPTFPTI
jgi:hypothetical protein